MTTQHDETVFCPNCNYALDASTSLSGDDAKPDDAKPKAGDYSVCINCAAVLRFDDSALPRGPVDIASIVDTDDYEFVARVVVVVRRMRGGGNVHVAA